ncbi:MAG: hypothetical protein IPM49_03675 [Flavobacteriales bacterium]|nr:hypothetical protein [Flavobacteriales bacterium]
MQARAALIAIKAVHTVIWVVLSAVIYYLLYAVIADRIDRWFWMGLGLVGLEIIALLLFRLSCPLTVGWLEVPRTDGARSDRSPRQGVAKQGYWN